MKNSALSLLIALKNGIPVKNRRLVLKFSLFAIGLFVIYSILFQILMAYEQREFSWITGFYWTLVVMSTLGYGDVVFYSDLGKLFSMLVNFTGIILLLVLLPFIIIEFIYNPLMKMQREANAPRTLPPNTSNHVLFLSFDAIAETLIPKLKSHNIPYAVIVPDTNEALRLNDNGYAVLVGEPDRPQTYQAAQVQNAALVAVNGTSDPINTNTVFTVRRVSPSVPIVAFSNALEALDILQLAGATEVLDIPSMLGTALSRCTSVTGTKAQIMGKIGDLLIAEASVDGTNLVGKTLSDLNFGKKYGITVVGLWKRGNFELAGPNTKLDDNAIIIMGLSQKQLDTYNKTFASEQPILGGAYILGAGRVGLAAARALRQERVAVTLIDKIHKPYIPEEFQQNFIQGDAADINFLNQSGFFNANAVLVTTHDDNTNIYLTLYFRKLRHDVQIVSRSSNEPNVQTLHQSGADFVISSATMASAALFNHLKQGHIHTMMEGLYARKVKTPPSMIGKSLIDLQFRVRTGASILALKYRNELKINPSPFEPIPENSEIIMVLTNNAEKKLLQHFGI